ncbi:MAG: GNAT family N-acetyltransferase [Clostridium sp.]
MSEDMKIQEIEILSDSAIEQLGPLLIDTVENGASVSILTPMCRDKARKYWLNVLDDGVYLFIAKIDKKIVGSVQLHKCLKENGRHRGEICKLMVHTTYRQQGIARKLMTIAEEKAKSLNLSLLLLNTRAGDVSNILYKNSGYIEAGKIPGYALSINGELDQIIIYYKNI